MLRPSELQEKLLHLIGWEQYYDSTSDLRIADSLTESESGLYFQQIHPLLTLQNLSCIAPDFKNEDSTIEEYNPEKVYSKGAIVQYEGKLYKSLADDNRGVAPKYDDSLPKNIPVLPWEETSLFSNWLEHKTKASIYKAITRFYNEKLVQKTATGLCEKKTLFDGTGRLTSTIQNRNRLVGFEIIPVRAEGVTIKINKIGLQFTEPGEYILYLLHSSSEAPIKTFKFTKLHKNAMDWFELKDVYLPYKSELTDAGGSWYLVYSQNELPSGSKAIRKDYDWSKGPCKGCSRNSFLAWQAWSKYLEVHPFYISEEFADGVHFSNDFNNDFAKPPLRLWDPDNNIYTYDSNYGINLEVTVECDLTDFIVEQKYSFVDLITRQLAIDMLREFAYNANVRTNRHSINASRVDIIYELDGDSNSMQRSGLNYEFELTLKALSIDTSGIDRICLPCNNNGVKYRAI